MFGKIIAAVAGLTLAKNTGGSIGGPGGAILGMGAMALAKRVSLPVLVAATAGGYFVKKHFDKKQAAEEAPKAPPKVKSSAM